MTGNEPARTDLQAVRLGVLSAVIDGDAGLAYRMVLDLLGAGVPFESILVEILGPLQSDIGARWGQGDYRIADEHASTGVVETLIAQLAGSFDRPDEGPRLAVACAEGDIHSLPPRMASAYLLYRGWHVTFLGSSIPARDLEDYLFETGHDTLVLSCTMSPWLQGARRSIEAAHAAGVPVMAGGRAFGSDDTIARKLGADGWSPSLVDLDTRLREWTPDPTASEAGVVEPPDDLARLRDLHPDLVARGLRELRELLAEIGWPQEAVPDVTKEMGLLIRVVGSALLIDDAALITDHVTAQAGLMSHQGAPEEIGPLMLRALDTALADKAPQAAPRCTSPPPWMHSPAESAHPYRGGRSPRTTGSGSPVRTERLQASTATWAA